MLFQKTIKSDLIIDGISLHSGKNSTMKMKPAPINYGIKFIRVDVEKDKSLIEAKYSNVSNTKLCTVLSNKYGVEVSTVEHFMAALSALGIDNLLIEINGSEMPVLDGSSKVFVEKILEVGLAQQVAIKKYLKVLKKVEILGDDWSVSLEPSEDMEFDYTIDYGADNAIGFCRFFYQESHDSFINELYKARTFCFKQEIDTLRANNLALGGSLDNAVVVDGMDIINSEGLRYNDEFARHKILDAIGDIYLSGYKVIGKFVGHKSGHEANNLLIRTLMSNKSNYEIVNIYQRSNNCSNNGKDILQYDSL